MGVEKYKVAAAQMKITREKSENLSRALSMIEMAGAEGVKAICFPEYFITDCPEKGMTKDEILNLAEPIPGPTINKIAEKARELKMFVVAGSIIEKTSDGELYNTSVLIGSKGDILGKYRKTHPENAASKYEVGSGILPGNEYPVFETEIGKIGILIDMDAVAVEVPRILSLKGAEIMFWPLNWSVRWKQSVELLSQTIAMVNKCFLVCSNRVGLRKSPFGNFLYNGGSKIIEPDGYPIGVTVDFYEGLAVATLDFDIMREWREEIIPRDYPYRRRPETYGEILKY